MSSLTKSSIPQPHVRSPIPPPPPASQTLSDLTMPQPPPPQPSVYQAKLVYQPIMWPPPSYSLPPPTTGHTYDPTLLGQCDSRVAAPYSTRPHSRQGSSGYFTDPPPPPPPEPPIEMNMLPRPLGPSPRHKRDKKKEK
ncbi:hypothetical protein L218DRAFT_1078519 [Marasmius fiardii PR-910]|nr:hypothetical protein L218DRAFT_1078519 [Marasmius fiardii PR-910]